MELIKSQRKIDETQRRTEEILSHQHRIEEKTTKKIEEIKQKQQEQVVHQQINQIQRTRMKVIKRVK